MRTSLKICCSCKNPKENQEFNKNNSTKDKLHKSCKSCRAIYRKTNTKKLNAYAKLWRVKNPQKSKNIYEKYRQAHYGKWLAKTRSYAISKVNRAPAWLTIEQHKEIEQFYILAKELRWLSEEPLHVDHIVPLQGELVSGLHVPWNLQIIPRSINCSKGNK